MTLRHQAQLAHCHCALPPRRESFVQEVEIYIPVPKAVQTLQTSTVTFA